PAAGETPPAGQAGDAPQAAGLWRGVAGQLRWFIAVDVAPAAVGRAPDQVSAGDGKRFRAGDRDRGDARSLVGFRYILPAPGVPVVVEDRPVGADRPAFSR